MASDAPERTSTRTKVVAADAAAAIVLLAVATTSPGWRPWVALTAVVAVIGELIRWRRARRSGDGSWGPLQPSTGS